MKIYKQNLGYFLNVWFTSSIVLIDPLWIVISYYMPITLLIPICFGIWLGYMEKDIDWELI